MNYLLIGDARVAHMSHHLSTQWSVECLPGTTARDFLEDEYGMWFYAHEQEYTRIYMFFEFGRGDDDVLDAIETQASPIPVTHLVVDRIPDMSRPRDWLVVSTEREMPLRVV